MNQDSYSYLGQNTNPTGFTNNWLASRDRSQFFTQNYNDFQLYEQQNNVPAKYYRDILKTSQERDDVSDMFFSEINIKHLKKLVCDIVYKQSKGLYSLTSEAQSTDQLVLIMRSIYLDNAKHLPDKIKEQVAELNYAVTLDLVPRVMSNVLQELSYRRDQSQQPLVMDRPQWMSNAGTKTLNGREFI